MFSAVGSKIYKSRFKLSIESSYKKSIELPIIIFKCTKNSYTTEYSFYYFK